MSEIPRILLVEDNAIYREALELLLGLRSDVEIAGSVADAEAALEFCAKDCPDVVLLDYRLPGLDGVEATRILLQRFSSLAVVCLTGLATERERQALIEAGAFACLTKDRELGEIVAAVHDAVESARER
ncbi:MAG TPA: response regulator transcription factor [Gaiellaceae bacterium]|jgi:DNA-binding NarL/FixJ family response regulator